MRGFFTSRLALVNEINALKMRNEGLRADLIAMTDAERILLRENVTMRAEINSMLEHNARLKQQLNSQRCIKRMRDAKGRFTK